MTRPTQLALYFAVFLDLAGFGMVIPDIQTRLEAQGASGAGIGAILSAYFLVQIVASPLWGRLSDRIGRKPVLVVCGGLSALSLLAYAFAHSPLAVLASRLLAGAAAANVVVAQAYLTDSVGGEESERAALRTMLLGRIGAATTAGLILGPAIGGWLAGTGGNLLLGLVAASASGLGALCVAAVVPAVPPQAARPNTEGGAGRPVRGWLPDLSLLADAPRLKPLLALAAVALFALACLEGTFGRLIRQRLGLGPQEFGLIFGYEALLAVVVQTALLRLLTARVGARALLVGAYALQAVGLALTPFAPSLGPLFGCSTFYAIGSGAAGPTVNALCAEAAPPERQGEAFGLVQAARSAGFLLGPTVGGALFDWQPEAPYLLAGVTLLIAAVRVMMWRME